MEINEIEGGMHVRHSDGWTGHVLADEYQTDAPRKVAVAPDKPSEVGVECFYAPPASLTRIGLKAPEIDRTFWAGVVPTRVGVAGIGAMQMLSSVLGAAHEGSEEQQRIRAALAVLKEGVTVVMPEAIAERVDQTYIERAAAEVADYVPCGTLTPHGPHNFRSDPLDMSEKLRHCKGNV